jgi:hypothetical protein
MSEPNVFRCDGDVWSLSFDGRSVVVPHAKGMRDLHILLSRPGVDVPVGALIGPDGGEWFRTNSHVHPDSVLDPQVKRDRLIPELCRATGLGDRSRRFSDNAERARKTVKRTNPRLRSATWRCGIQSLPGTCGGRSPRAAPAGINRLRALHGSLRPRRHIPTYGTAWRQRRRFR